MQLAAAAAGLIEGGGVVDSPVPDQRHRGQGHIAALHRQQCAVHAGCPARGNLHQNIYEGTCQRREKSIEREFHTQVHAECLANYLEDEQCGAGHQEGLVGNNIYAHSLQHWLVAAHINREAHQLLQWAGGRSADTDVEWLVTHLRRATLN